MDVHPVTPKGLDMTEITDTPNPGSDEAVDAGCLCPVMDNRRGEGLMVVQDDITTIGQK